MASVDYDENQIKDKTRFTLNEALKMFGEFSRVSAWRQLESEFQITLTGVKPISKEDIEVALKAMFGDGSALIMRSFEKELSKL